MTAPDRAAFVQAVREYGLARSTVHLKSRDEAHRSERIALSDAVEAQILTIYDALRAELDVAMSAVADGCTAHYVEIEAERDAAVKRHSDVLDMTRLVEDRLRAEFAALTADNERLRAALNGATALCVTCCGSGKCGGNRDCPDCREIRAALAPRETL